MNYLEVAKQIAKEAGNMIKLRMDDEWLVEEKSSSTDIVTEIDKASEDLIKERIREAYPEHHFLGEEEAFQDPQCYKQTLGQANNIPFLWIVDPIDGTKNFVQGIQGFTVSIALACYGELRVGVIYDPVIDEMFWAERGQGAYVNDKRIRVSNMDKLGQCVVGASISSNDERRKIELNSIDATASQCLTVRVLGSAAVNLAYVAVGRLDAFWHYRLNPWDVAAGVVIIEEAGGKVTDTAGSPYHLSAHSIYGSNGHIHELLLNSIKY